MKDFRKFIISIAFCELVGLISTPLTLSSISNWYVTLNKPFLTPPGWVFGPAWTILYFLMGVSFYLIWTKNVKGKGVKEKTIAVRIFLLQLALNFLWSFIFFYLQQKLFAVIEIIGLWFAIIFSIIFFKKISKFAAWLLIPYLLWVSFATYLTIGLWLLNP